MNHRTFKLSSAVFLAALLATTSASAQILRESFENNAPGWNTLPSGGRCSSGTFEAVRTLTIESSSTAADCSGKFMRERLPGCGGRVFSKPVATTPGQTYCLTTWIRHGAGANVETAYAGVNGTDNTGTQFLAEQWLVGGSIAGAGQVPAGNVDGKWHWYAATFVATDNFTMIQSERFSSGADADADFDEQRIYQGACPAAPAADEGSHGACSGPTPACDASTGGTCVQCTDDTFCGGATPGCKASTKKCVACVTDAHCAANAWCNSGDNGCKPDVANGQAIPTDAGHSPALNGTCTAPIGAIVCASGVCDTDNLCGRKPGSTCGATPECRTGTCTQGVCSSPIGDAGNDSAPPSDGGSTSSSSSSTGSSSGASTSSGAAGDAGQAGSSSGQSSGGATPGTLEGGGCSTTSTNPVGVGAGLGVLALGLLVTRRRRG